MQKVKTVKWANSCDLLGKAIQIYLKNGGAFNFKVIEAGPDHIAGYDDEYLTLTIAIEDIDFIIGG